MSKNVFADISITMKFILSILLVLIVAFTAGGFLLNGFVKERLTASYFDAVHTLSTTLESGTKGSLERGQMKNFKKLLDEQKNIKGVVDISLYDRKGALDISSSFDDAKGKDQLDEAMFQRLLDEQEVIEEFLLGTVRIISPQIVNADCIRCHPSWKTGELGGAMVLTYTTENLTTNISTLQRYIVYGCLSLLAGICLIVFVITKSITRPLIIMTDAMGELANNKLEIEIPAQDRSDEIGRMSKAVKIFQLNAHEKQRLTESVHSMADAFELSIGGIVSSISSAVNDLQGSAEVLSNAAKSSSQRSSEAASSTETTANSVLAVSDATSKLTAAVEEISNQIQMSSEAVHEASTKAETTNEMVASLSDASKQISNVTQLISDIAGQTDLLALNATIEAARAGEVGKGFAVVAGEVKELAKQTTDATRKIGNQVEGIQNAADDVISALTVFREIIEKMDGISASISTAIGEQSAATENICECTEQAKAGTEEVTSSVVVVMETAENTSSAAHMVLDNADELAKQADVLNQEVSTFLDKVRTIN
ncbi:MAG: methyl-accepting chemotaxis protein [Desulfobulbaceae bacterium]|nr:methyl-accepting chemotaxis protein [Desulfobulbaceae bacterium]